MESVENRLIRLREERVAREKARLEKLREMNLKKYNKTEPISVISKTQPENELKKTKSSLVPVKNNFHVNGNTKRPITAPISRTNINDAKNIDSTKPNINLKVNQVNKISSTSSIPKVVEVKSDKMTQKTGNLAAHTAKSPGKHNLLNIAKKPVQTEKLTVKNGDLPGASQPVKSRPKWNIKSPAKPNLPSHIVKKPMQIEPLLIQKKNLDGKTQVESRVLKEIKPKTDIKMNLSKFALKNSMRRSLVPLPKPAQKLAFTRKSVVVLDSKESVFERLYKPKYEPRKTLNNVEKIHKDPAYLKQVIKSTGRIIPCNLTKQPVRRSISAVHFKRVNKSELKNCIHKCSSVGDKLNKIHLDNDILVEEQVTSAVKSERKKVKFMTPMPFNTPRPEELQYRLKNWLQKHGKSLDSYHHLQCFGLHHLPSKPVIFSQKVTGFDEENKENVALDSDSDDGSYNENTNQEDHEKQVTVENDFDKWRRVSTVSEMNDFDDSSNQQLDETLTSQETSPNDNLITGALTDLAELTREGFDWKQSVRWLRAIKERYPEVIGSAAYWECKAVLEECRGEAFASFKCWEEAIAKGTEQKVAEANLDHLLDKFIKLKINPSSGSGGGRGSGGETDTRTDDKMLLDMKNIFRSSVIRFTITQAKQRQAQTPVPCVTPVRRSGRLSVCPSQRTVCQTMKQVNELAPVHQFTPNRNLVASP